MQVEAVGAVVELRDPQAQELGLTVEETIENGDRAYTTLDDTARRR
jgi:hypothetical protein